MIDVTNVIAYNHIIYNMIFVFWRPEGVIMKVLFSFSHQTLLLSSLPSSRLKFHTIYGRCKKFFAHYIASTRSFQVSEEFKIDRVHKAIVIRNPHHYSIVVTIVHMHHDKQHTITLKPKQSVLFVHDDHVTHDNFKAQLVKEVKVLGYVIRVLEIRFNDYDVQYRIIVHKGNMTRMIRDANDARDLPKAVSNEIRRLLRKYPIS